MQQPSAPPLELPAKPAAAAVVPEPLPPSARSTGMSGLLWLTVKLVPYHALNFALATVAFPVVLTGLCVSAVLLPFCLLGVPVYLLLLQVTRVFVIVDVALANTITRSQAEIHWKVPDEIDESSAIAFERRLAPKLARISFRSTLVVVYFVTVKFVLGMISCVAVSLPLLPIISELVADFATDAANTVIAGWPVAKFNFGTNPFLYFLTCVGFFIGGVLLMHVFGRVSRETTRRVCAQEIKPTGAPRSSLATAA
jgi:hypothetical protein